MFREAAEKGDIPEERINEAVTRIMQFKIDEGLFTDNTWLDAGWGLETGRE